jgi:hypothetical protein
MLMAELDVGTLVIKLGNKSADNKPNNEISH